MGATEKYSRYRWKEGREKDLWTFVDGRVKEGASVTSALKEYGKRHNMSWLTARWKYYQVRKREVGPAEVTQAQATPEESASVEAKTAQRVTVAAVPDRSPAGDDFIASLSEFVSMSREGGEDVATLMRGLARMASMARESSRIAEDRGRRLEEMKADAAVVREVRSFLAEWLSLPQVDRVASLQGFSDRLSDLSGRLEEVEGRLEARS